jgi:effector-binding domain-containing protein
MTFTCEYKELPAQPILVVRVRTHVEELPQVFGQWYGAIAGYLAELGETPAGAPFAVYYNMDMQDLDMGIGFPVARSLPAKGEIVPGEIPGGSYATCLYTGPYSELGLAYDALNQWVAEKGYTPSGVVYEMYLDDPSQTPPQEMKTLVLFPIQ